MQELYVPNLNLRSSDEDSLNKDLPENQKENPKSATQTSLNPDIKRNLKRGLTK